MSEEKMKPLVIYHADCTDGFGAAFAAWLKLGDAADYCAMNYQDKDVPEWRDREVYILDFSFPRHVMDAIFMEAKRLVWLDHHKTAFEMWCGGLDSPAVKNGQYGERSESCTHYIELDNNKSGALLAWEYFHKPSWDALEPEEGGRSCAVPMLIRHIDDRDRWQFKLEGSRELHAALQSYKPWSFEQWEQHFKVGGVRFRALLDTGRDILRAQEQNIASMLKQARKCYLQHGFFNGGGSCAEGLALNAPIHQSEIGHELATQSGTFGLVWHVSADFRAKCSLRSNGEYDVSSIARAFGGGGHRNAAGFETDIQTLMGWLE